MACIAEFGRGNFEAPLERVPGKKVFINETIEQVRALEDEALFNELQLDKLLAAEEARTGKPESAEGAKDQSAEIRENFQIVITCVDESEQSTLLQRFMDEGLKCRALI